MYFWKYGNLSVVYYYVLIAYAFSWIDVAFELTGNDVYLICINLFHISANNGDAVAFALCSAQSTLIQH